MKRYFFAWVALFLSVATNAGVIAQDPLFISAQADPRVMLVASRDHQLFMKAYSDYSDLDSDGFLDTSFVPYIEYDGYFNPRKCYTYQNSRFEATAAATNETVTVSFPDGSTASKTQYVCSNKWSGNLLNWASMTRVDVLRKVMYGGYRSTDDENATVLERSHLPPDVHAFAKVFNPGTTAVMNRFTPYNDQSAISFCNLTNDGTSASRSSTNPPVMQIANGQYRLWAANESPQCGLDNTKPTKPLSIRETLNVRVKVCDDGGGTDTINGPGPKCKTYPKGMAKKPIGLLQQYGDADVSLSLKFGLMTGSWAHNKSGGVLRKNIGKLSNNSGKYPNNYNCTVAGEGFMASSEDEIDFCTGVFVNNQGKARSASSSDDLPSTGGIVGTLNRLRIVGWGGSHYGLLSGNNYDGKCSTFGSNLFSNGQCIDWGNPISEMYLESLRYLRAGNATTSTAISASAASPTSAFNGSDASFVAGLPQLSWKDPIPSNEWCAKCNIVMISTGLNSFDYDQTSHDLGWVKTTAELTNMLADSTHENLSGQVMVGSVDGESSDTSTCSEKTLGNFSSVSGICPEMPSVGGSYHMGGLALGSGLYDLRPGYSSKRTELWGTSNPDYAARQPLSTFAVALAENLPDFSAKIGSYTVKFLPFCQANVDGNAGLSASGWKACSMVDLVVEPETTETSGSFQVIWEDSTWGNDYDMDGVMHLRYCVGSACAPYAGQNGMPMMPGSSTLYIKVASMTAAAGNALKYGYVITGTSADGTVLNVLRPGNANYSTYSASSEFTKPVASWTSPTWVAYTPSTTGSATLLKNPLYYTAKYAAWPNWDVKINDASRTPGSDGVPDNFFEVRNPAGLDLALGSALKESLGDASSSSAIATNSTRLDTGTFVYQARFKASDWSGQVLAYPLELDANQNVALGSLAWDAGLPEKFPASTDRRVYTLNRSASPMGVNFQWNSLSSKQKAALDNTSATVAASTVIDYLRGDQSQELTDSNNDGVFDSGIYRPRPTSLMGDIINSDPVFLGNQNFYYGDMAAFTGSDTYGAFFDSKLVTTSGAIKNPLIVVNSNDGMMHAIDAQNGNEIFTYIPGWLICQDETGATGCTSGADSSPLRNLLSYGMSHRYLLDGNLVVGDAYIDKGAGAAWRTVVVGAAAAGGKGIFALDLTKSFAGTGSTSSTSSVANTQSNYAALTAAETVMWEFTDKHGDVDLGYTFGQPVIARMANGAWAAVFGNGYNSATGKAVLYIVRLSDGTLIKKIDVNQGSVASPNGLSAPAAIFDTGTGALSAVFAGDLRGNLWKFDVSSTNTNSWGVDNQSGGNPVPLFTAFDDTGNRQPITGGLEIGGHPSGGYLVYFGTGKYFEKDDDSTTSQQTLYAIWDQGSSNDEIAASSVDTGSEKDNVLQKHSILVGTTESGEEYKVTDDLGAIPWSGAGAKRGWYMNLTSSSGERVVTYPILRNKRVIFTSMVPSASPCDFGGTSWIWEFNAETGNRPDYSVFDVNGDGIINNADYVTVTINGQQVTVPANAIKSSEGIIKSPAIISSGEKEYKIASGTTGGVEVVAEKGSTTRPRTAWRQLQ